MKVAEIADGRRHIREARQRQPRQVTASAVAREGTGPVTGPARRQAACPGGRQRTGFEPFLIAAVLGLCIWALILSALFL